jgi:hypothetical protein
VQKPSLIFACQVQSVPGPLGANIQRLRTKPGIISRAGWGREVEKVIDFSKIERLTDVLLHQGESRFIVQVRQVGRTPGGKIIYPHHVMALGKKSVAQMRAEEAGGAGDQDTMSRQNTVSPVLESIEQDRP